MEGVKCALSVKFQPADQKQHILVSLVEQSMDQENRQKDRKRKSDQRKRLFQDLSAGQNTETDCDKHTKHPKLSSDQRNTDGGSDIHQFCKGMHLRQICPVIYKQADTFHIFVSRQLLRRTAAFPFLNLISPESRSRNLPHTAL